MLNPIRDAESGNSGSGGSFERQRTDVTRISILSTGNSVRSKMAEALLRLPGLPA
jgi:hypothetical protein